jgi:hypothetical protein
MNKKLIEAEANSVDDASEVLMTKLPEGFIILSEEILSNGNLQTVEGIADTTEAAFSAAEAKVPANAEIAMRKERVVPLRKILQVNAYDDEEAKESARLPSHSKIESVALNTEGRKGFLGFGKTPHLYDVTVSQQSVVELRFKEKAKIRAQIGAVDELGTLHYEDPGLNFSFDLPGRWNVLSHIRPWGCTLQCQQGLMNVRAGEVEDHLVDREVRTREYLKFLTLRGFKNIISVDNDRTLGSETNVSFFEYRTPDNRKGMGISAVHYLIIYNIQLDGFPQYIIKETIEHLSTSFRFPSNDKVDLAIRQGW